MRLVPFLALATALASSVQAEFDPERLVRLSCHGERPFVTGGTIGRLVPHPDGRRLLGCSADHSVRLWNIEDGGEIRRFPHDERTWALSLHPDGKRFLSGGNDDRITLWDLESGESLRRYERTDAIYDIAIRPGGEGFLAGKDDKILQLKEIEDGDTPRDLKGHKKDVYAVEFLSTNRVLSGSDGGELILWDLAKAGAKVKSITAASDVFSLARHPSSNRVAACLQKSQVRVYDDQGEEAWRIEVPGEPRTATWSGDGKRLACITTSGRLHLFRGTNELWMTELGAGDTWAVAWSTDDAVLFAGRGNQVVRIDPADGTFLDAQPEHRAPVDPTALLLPRARPNRALVLSDLGLHWFDREGGKPMGLEQEESAFRFVATSPGGTRIAASDLRTVRLFDSARLEETAVLARAPTSIRELLFLDEQRLVVIMSSKFQLWDLSGPRPRLRHTHALRYLYQGGVPMAGGTTFAVSTRNSAKDLGHVVLINPETGEEVQRLPAEQEYVRRIVGDGSSLLAYADGKAPILHAWRAPRPAEPVPERRLDQLVADLGGETYRVRTRAVRSLGQAGEPAAKRLRPLLADPDPEVRFQAAEALTLIARNQRLPDKPLTLKLEHNLADLHLHPDGVHWIGVSGKGVHGRVLVGAVREDRLEVLRTLEDDHGAARARFDRVGRIVVANHDGSITTWGVE